MFRIPKSQLSRPRDSSTPRASASSVHAEGDSGPSHGRQRPAGLRPPFTPFLGSAAARGPDLQLPASRPSTAACSKTTSSLGVDDDGGEDRSFGYRRRLRERHVTQEEGGGACVVVVAPGPVAAAAAAASKRQNRRLRPPTPVEGDGFPSIKNEQRSRAAAQGLAPTVASPVSTYATSGLSYSSSSLDTATTARTRATRRSVTEEDEASHGDRSGGSSRTADEPGSGGRYYQPKVGARVMLAVLVGSSLLLLALLLAYNTEAEKAIIHKVKLVFEKSLRRRLVHEVANSTNSTSMEAGGDDDGGSGGSRGATVGETSTLTDFPENAEEFENRVRELVSRFWTPRGDYDYAAGGGGGGGFGFDPQRTIATRRGWRYRRRDDEIGGPPPIPRIRGGDDNAGLGHNEPTEPFVKDAPNRGTNWFMVQARRRRGRLPGTFNSGNDSIKRSGNGSLEDAAEIEQFWQEGDDIDEDDAKDRV